MPVYVLEYIAVQFLRHISDDLMEISHNHHFGLCVQYRNCGPWRSLKAIMLSLQNSNHVM